MQQQLHNVGGVCCNGGRATWVVAQVDDVPLHPPVLSHADGVCDGARAL